MSKLKNLFITFVLLLSTALGAVATGVNPQAIIEYNNGIDFYKEANYSAAVSSFREAIRIDPSYIDAYYNLGSVLEYQQQYEAALAVFKQVIVRQPNDYDSVYKAAWLSAKLGQYQHALDYLSIIPSSSPRGADARALAAQLNLSLPKKTASSTASKPVVLTTKIFTNLASPTGVTTDSKGNMYVAAFTTNTIMKVTPAGKRIVFAKNAKISGPIGLACDKAGNLYIANYNKNNILKVSTVGEITTLVSNVKKPYCLYYTNGVLFISCQGSNSVLRYRL
ncbi:tetratricopeptide repeat protein [bacterium]|nr:tetratricopeptide repeat protein [bacterium]